MMNVRRMVAVVGLMVGILCCMPTTVSAQGLVYVPVKVCRVVDTRLIGLGTLLLANVDTHFNVRGNPAPLQGGSDPCGLPDEAEVAVMNVVSVQSSATGFMEVFPWNSRPTPPTSQLNYQSGVSIANEINVKLASISLAGFEFSVRPTTTTHVVIDVIGYYYSE